MVRRKTKSSPLIWLLPLVIIICAGATFGLLTLLKKPAPAAEEISAPAEPEVVKTAEFISLNQLVDSFVTNVSGKTGIVIYDLNNQQIAGKYNQDELFGTASLYKLFVVYEGYLEVGRGELDPEKSLVSGHTIGKCLDLAIRESNSACAEALRSTIGAAKIDQLATEWGMTNTSVSGLSSTPSDIAKIMQKYYEHAELSEETWVKIQDSMLNQPPVENGLCSGPCDWRQGMPSGFTIAKVYNKVGWEHSGSGNTWRLYHDAAIVEFPETDTETARSYIVVIMTSQVPLEDIVKFGSMLEQAVLTRQPVGF